MSDDEYEYEYDDDEMEEDNFEYTDEEEEADDTAVALENAYYNSKGLRETNLREAAESFEQVIKQELEFIQKEGGSSKKYGQWSYKSMKQLVKIHLRAGDADAIKKYYDRLLECISEGDISPNAVEKGVNGMLERISSLYQGGASANMSSSASLDTQKLALAVYDSTLRVFHPRTGASPSERLWFKTNLKYGQLLYEMNETVKLQKVLRDLKAVQSATEDTSSSSTSGASTQSIEIYALQIQLYSRQKDNKKLREVFNKAMAVQGGIPHPRTLALIQELGGKMHMASSEYEEAGKTFFQAFKSYDEAGDPSRLRCLKYLVLASMLHASSINPFDSQEARPYKDDPEITAMTNLVQAFQGNDIQTFERILKKNSGSLMRDEFIREHIEDLLRTIRLQVLRRAIRPYSRISLEAISRELNDIPVADVEKLLVKLILDGNLEGRIDQVSGILLKKAERGVSGTTSDGQSSQTALATSTGLDILSQKYQALERMTKSIDDLSSSITNVKIVEMTPYMRSLIH